MTEAVTGQAGSNATPHDSTPGNGAVGIIGLGYVGLPLAVAFAEAGLTVVGVDTSADKVGRRRRWPLLHRGRPLGVPGHRCWPPVG